MTHSLESLAERLQRLEDLEAIRSIIAQYGPLADSGDGEALSQLWTDNGEYEVVGFAAAQGRGAIAGLIEGANHRSLMCQGCAHLLGPVAIELDGDLASARGHSVIFRHLGDGQFEAHRVAANCWTLERRAEGWRVIHRANALLDGQETARMLLTPRVAPHRP
ncbi:nuclear transport factor 2 family protein [Novosphingobium mathurense]|uniref:SnoaL-like domain-containing protein n=1 Tax=Novosphingobium mathurense TaxID=428990 RepID=A0A1U6HY85_9SPHN|nr:nuclear transport factor 2 family protein [Novosphingobium mathurense]SLK00793.1 conserved hypothetical protein [Novosphingobium mathurense]